MAITMLILLLAVAAVWMQLPARPHPAKVRRNVLQEDLLVALMNRPER